MAKSKTDCPFEVGAYAIFKGYGEGAEGELQDGEIVKILEVTEDDEGTSLAVESLITGEADSAFYPEEVEEEASEEEVEAALAEAGGDDAEADADETDADAEAETDEADAEEADAEEAEPEPAPKKTTRKAPAKKAAAKTTAKKAPAKKTTAKKAPASKAKLPAKTKAAAKKTDAKANAKPEPVEIIDIQAVTDAIAEGEDALGAAEMLAQRAEMTFYTLGGVLLHIERDGLHRDVEDAEGNAYEEGQKGFNKYVSEELGLEYRKARYYMQMYQHFTHLGVDEEVVVSVGWTKAREIVKIGDKEQALQAFEEAKDMTRDELVDYVKEVTVEADKAAGKKTTTKTTETKGSKAKKLRFSFSALEEQGKIVQDALDKAGEIIGSDDLAEQFQHIITEWAMTSGNVEVSQEDAIAVLENTYGIEVEVVEADAKAAPPKAKPRSRKKAA